MTGPDPEPDTSGWKSCDLCDQPVRPELEFLIDDGKVTHIGCAYTFITKGPAAFQARWAA